MAHTRKKYSNGQSRGGTPGHATNTSKPEGRNPKDYYAIAKAFHGGDVAYERWIASGRKGY